MLVKHSKLFVIGIALFCSFAPRYFFDIWRWQWFLGCLLTSGILAYVIGKRLHASIGLSWWIFSLSGLMLWAHPSPYALTLKWTNAATFGLFALTSLGAAFYPRKWQAWLLESIWWVLLASCLVIIARKAFGSFANSIIGNAAADASLIAAFTPFIVFQQPVILFKSRIKMLVLKYMPGGLLAGAVFLSDSSTALVLFTLTCFVYTCLRFKFSLKKVTPFVLGLFIFGITTLVFMKDRLLEGNGRYRVWDISLKFWAENFNPLVGSFSGMYMNLSQLVQCPGKTTCNTFFFTHNEFIQILFENGILALASILFVWFILLRKSFDRPWLFTSILGYGLMAGLQYPFRFFVPAFLGAIFVRETFHHQE